MMIAKGKLVQLYTKQGKSMQEIAEILSCSPNRVKYWLVKYNVLRRSISEAVYLKNNPDGDPFCLKMPHSLAAAKLYGMGLGLYWGEGTKANKYSVRLGNTDPELIERFIYFLEEVFTIERKDLRFSLQIFSDMCVEEELKFWVKALRIDKSQIGKPTITPYRSIGTYRKKTRHGVLIVYYHNKKMRDLLIRLLQAEGLVLA